MKHSLFIASFLVLLFTFAIQTADARSGCCSHHGGVCGCGCCDGSPLSSTCAPYYPECNSDNTSPSNQSIQQIPPVTHQPYFSHLTFPPPATPTNIPTITYTPTPTI